MSLARELFDFDRRESDRDRLCAFLLEIVVVGWTVWFMWSWVPAIEAVRSVVAPLGLANHLDISFVSIPGVALANAAVVTILLLGGAARRGRWLYAAALVGFHVQYVARFCLGKAGHGPNVIGIALLAFALGHIAFRDPARARKTAVGLCLFLVGLGYVSAAVCKLVATGPSWVDGRHLWLWIGEKALDSAAKYGRADLNAVQRAVLDSRALATLVLASGLLAELLGFLIWFRRTRLWIIIALAAVHVGIWLTMDILFQTNLVVLCALACQARRRAACG